MYLSARPKITETIAPISWLPKTTATIPAGPKDSNWPHRAIIVGT